MPDGFATYLACGLVTCGEGHDAHRLVFCQSVPFALAKVSRVPRPHRGTGEGARAAAGGASLGAVAWAMSPRPLAGFGCGAGTARAKPPNPPLAIGSGGVAGRTKPANPPLAMGSGGVARTRKAYGCAAGQLRLGYRTSPAQGLLPLALPGFDSGVFSIGGTTSPPTICLRTIACSPTLPVSMPSLSAAFGVSITRLAGLPGIGCNVSCGGLAGGA